MKSALFNKKTAAVLIAGISMANSAFAQIARPYDSGKHFEKLDPQTGYSVGTSLYQIKVNELGNFIKQASEYAEHSRTKSRTNGETALEVDDSKETTIEKMVAALVEKRNRDLMLKMNSLPIPQVPEKSLQVPALSKQQIVSTAQSIEYTPANDARPEMKKKYDPKGNFGLCFLRAHYYSLASVTRGLDIKSVKKVFLVGTMMPLGFLPVGTWQFHVATAVRGVDGQWYVLDNHLGIDKAYTVEQWYEYYEGFLNTRKEHDIKLADGSDVKVKTKALFLFFTDPWKIGASSNAYNKEAFFGEDKNNNGQVDADEFYYNGVFKDVDDLFLTTRDDGSVVFRTVPFCSQERYKRYTDADPRCQTDHASRINRAYNERVQKWKSDYALEKQQENEARYNNGGQ